MLGSFHSSVFDQDPHDGPGAHPQPLGDDVEAALHEQAQMYAALEAETARYGRYVYVDRDDDTLLRLGFGKHVGTPLHEVEPSYLSWVLGLDNLPPAAADAMTLVRAMAETMMMGEGRHRRHRLSPLRWYVPTLHPFP